MKKEVLIFLLVFLAGCATENNVIYCNFSEYQTEFTDEEILNATYSNCKIPLNFYHDIKIYEDVDYRGITKESGWDFYCGNNFEEERTKVKDLIAKNIELDGKHRELINSIKEDKYYEFIVDESGHIIKYRIFRCDYLENLNYGVYTFQEISSIGKFANNMSLEETKEGIEFLWYSGFLQNYKNEGVNALSSFIREKDEGFTHIIYETRASTNEQGCDEIRLIKDEFAVNSNGEISFKQELIKKIDGNNCSSLEIPTDSLVFSS